MATNKEELAALKAEVEILKASFYHLATAMNLVTETLQYILAKMPAEGKSETDDVPNPLMYH